jgi:hypothetical protein
MGNNWGCVASSADGGKLVAGELAPTNPDLKLSWLVPSTNFVMQQSSDLGSWMDMTNTPALNLTNLQNEVILSPTGRSCFYRLKTP